MSGRVPRCRSRACASHHRKSAMTAGPYRAWALVHRNPHSGRQQGQVPLAAPPSVHRRRQFHRAPSRRPTIRSHSRRRHRDRHLEDEGQQLTSPATVRRSTPARKARVYSRPEPSASSQQCHHESVGKCWRAAMYRFEDATCSATSRSAAEQSQPTESGLRNQVQRSDAPVTSVLNWRGDLRSACAHSSATRSPKWFAGAVCGGTDTSLELLLCHFSTPRTGTVKMRWARQ